MKLLHLLYKYQRLVLVIFFNFVATIATLSTNTQILWLAFLITFQKEIFYQKKLLTSNINLCIIIILI